MKCRDETFTYSKLIYKGLHFCFEMVSLTTVSEETSIFKISGVLTFDRTVRTSIVSSPENARIRVSAW